MSYEIINLMQGSPEWLKFRKNHLGASDMAAVMGCSPWKTRNELWKEKLGLSEDKPPNPAMIRGLEMEKEARQRYCELFSVEVEPLVVKSTALPFLSASYDGVTKDRKRAVELKCPMRMEEELDVPKHYKPQLQDQIYMLELDWISYFSYHPQGWKHCKEGRDDKYIKVMLDKASEFWDKVLTFEKPDPEKYQEKSNDEWWKNHINELWELKQKRKIDEKRENELTDLLKDASEGKDCKVNRLIFSSYERKGNIQYDLIPELKGLDLELYRKPPSTCWKLSEEK